MRHNRRYVIAINQTITILIEQQALDWLDIQNGAKAEQLIPAQTIQLRLGPGPWQEQGLAAKLTHRSLRARLEERDPPRPARSRSEVDAEVLAELRDQQFRGHRH